MPEPVIDPTRDRQAFLNQPWLSDPVIAAYKRHIAHTLRANFKRPPEERPRKAMALQQFAEDLRSAGRRLLPREEEGCEG